MDDVIDTKQVKAHLATHYRLHPIAVRVVPLGTETANFRAHLADGTSVFVKVHRTDSDTSHTRTRLAVSEFARTGGIPVPAVLPDRHDQLLSTDAGIVTSVWENIDSSDSEPLDMERAKAIGRTLGRLHHRLARYPTRGVARLTSPWEKSDPVEVAGQAKNVLAVIDSLSNPTGTDQIRREQVARRCDDLLAYGEQLKAELPSITHQVVHCDYGMHNLLFNWGELRAVIDFRGQVASPAWELGNIAFNSFTVARSSCWRQIAMQVIAGYAKEQQRLVGAELVSCARIALLDAMLALYPINVLYSSDGKTVRDDGLAAYWNDRATMVSTLLDALPDLEAELADTFT
ncbi:phosphotransferase [Streptomyces sp. NBC_01381]|uniref:phosphotransferase enzyme family protein n=1 Tax=Streptomyces sp. NBC_01381 TaxID=2903845 RepID=UPI0022566D8F|nr:phosphotransferase [Streptomyces sp. NBC_01381]MCX4666545.1 phosphotransferase [Streptomyces sp. NBC_01381]